MTSCRDMIITSLRQPFDTWTILHHSGVISQINTDPLFGALESLSLKYTHAEASVIQHFQRSSLKPLGHAIKAKFYVFSLTCMFTKVEVKASLILQFLPSMLVEYLLESYGNCTIFLCAQIFKTFFSVNCNLIPYCSKVFKQIGLA